MLSNAGYQSDSQGERFYNIRLDGLNLKTMMACQMQGGLLSCLFRTKPQDVREALEALALLASHSGFEPLIKSSRRIRRHWKGILIRVHKEISNGIIEVFDSIFQASKAKAKGYNRSDNISPISKLPTSKIGYSKINGF